MLYVSWCSQTSYIKLIYENKLKKAGQCCASLCPSNNLVRKHVWSGPVVVHSASSRRPSPDLCGCIFMCIIPLMCRCGAQSTRQEEFTTLPLNVVPGGSVEQMLEEYLMVSFTWPRPVTSSLTEHTHSVLLCVCVCVWTCLGFVTQFIWHSL